MVVAVVVVAVVLVLVLVAVKGARGIQCAHLVLSPSLAFRIYRTIIFLGLKSWGLFSLCPGRRAAARCFLGRRRYT